MQCLILTTFSNCLTCVKATPANYAKTLFFEWITCHESKSAYFPANGLVIRSIGN